MHSYHIWLARERVLAGEKDHWAVEDVDTGKLTFHPFIDLNLPSIRTITSLKTHQPPESSLHPDGPSHWITIEIG